MSRYTSSPEVKHGALVKTSRNSSTDMGFGKMVSPYRFSSVMEEVAGADTRKSRMLEPVKRTQRESERDCKRMVGEAASASSMSGPARVDDKSRWVRDGSAVTKVLKICGGMDLAPRTLRRCSPGNVTGSSKKRTRPERVRRWT